MTTLISWASVDNHGPSAVYIASDSRVTWMNTNSKWNYCRKVFSIRGYYDILGYCGDAFFASQILSQVVYSIESHVLYSVEEDADSKFNKIFNLIRSSVRNYPKELLTMPFTILYCTLHNKKFSCYCFSMKSYNDWKIENLQIPKHSGIIGAFGSGADGFINLYIKYQGSDYAETSRGVFNCLCDFIKSNNDQFTGGAPQLVGIYRGGQVKTFGTIFENNRYINGMFVGDIENYCTIEWRNELFERCDGRTMDRLKEAQSQPKVRNIDE